MGINARRVDVHGVKLMPGMVYAWIQTLQKRNLIATGMIVPCQFRMLQKTYPIRQIPVVLSPLCLEMNQLASRQLMPVVLNINGGDETACKNTMDAEDKQCEFCSFDGFNFCFNEDQAQIINQFGGQCGDGVVSTM